MRLLIKNGFVVDGMDQYHKKTDIYIENGKIVDMKDHLSYAADQTLDASDCIVFPGFIDAHCHLRDPGYEYKEDIVSGTKAAAQGGFTSIACMPNTNPIADSKAVISYIKNKAKSEGLVHVFPIGAVTVGQQGNMLAEMGDMKSAGAVAVSDDGKPVISAAMMRKAMMYAHAFDLTVISHCEEPSLCENGVMNEGMVSTALGLLGMPREGEEIMVARDLIMAEHTKIPVHIAHVSTKGSVALIKAAKQRGVQVTCETCPHYFSLTEQEVEGYNTMAKMNPPLRTEQDRLAIIEGLADDTIDLIATDHAPHHADEKRTAFHDAANGIVGFETAYGLCNAYLLKPGVITLSQFVKKICVNPAKLFKIDKGILRIGADADLTIVDPKKSEKISADALVGKGKNTPYDGWTLEGSVLTTIVEGRPRKLHGTLVT